MPGLRSRPLAEENSWIYVTKFKCQSEQDLKGNCRMNETKETKSTIEGDNRTSEPQEIKPSIEGLSRRTFLGVGSASLASATLASLAVAVNAQERTDTEK